MTLRTALRIDGDATGAERAATTVERGMERLGEIAKRTASELATAPKSAMDEYGRLNHVLAAAQIYFRQMEHQTKTAAAAAAQSAGQASEAIDKAAQAAANTANAGNAASVVVGRLAAIITPARVLTIALNAASLAAGYLFSTLRSETSPTERALEEHARLVGLIKEAYRSAATAAGDFFKQSREITLLQSQQNLIALQGKLRSQSMSTVNSVTNERAVPLTDSGGLGIPGDFPMLMPAGREATGEWKAFSDVIDRFNQSMAAGVPDVEAFRNEIAKLGLAAAATNPELAAQAGKLLERTKAEGETAYAIRQTEASIRLMQGSASEADRKLLGLSTTTKKVNDEFTRAQRSVRLQIERLDIEARTYSMTASEAARFRAEQILLNAARAAGTTLTPAVVAGINAQADAMGAAAGRLKELADRQAGIDYLKETTSSFFSDLRQNLKDGEDGWRAWGDAVSKAVDRAIDKFLELAANDFWTQMLGGKQTSGLGNLWNFLGLGGGTGWGTTSAAAGASSYMWGGISVPVIGHGGGMAGLLGSSGRAMSPAALNDNIPRFHRGKPPLGPGELLAIVQDQEEILTPSDPRHRWNGGAASRGDTIVSVSLKVDARGAQQGAGEEIVNLLSQWVKTPAFKNPVIEAVRESESRRFGS